jgi:hypothetical protein
MGIGMNVRSKSAGLNCIVVLGSAAGFVAALSGTAARAGTSAHAMVVSGQAGHAGGGAFDCATSGPQPNMLARFGTGNGLPTEGYAYCGLAGGIVDNSSATGVSAAHVDLGSSGNSFNNGLHLQKSDATADFGVLKASSSGSYTGDPGFGFGYTEGEGAAVSTDTLPTPTGKFVQFGFTIDGSASAAKSSQAQTFFNYQINSGPIFTIFVANVLGDSSSVRGLDGSSIVDLAGFTVAPGSASGKDTVYTFRTELPSNPTFDLTLGLYAGSYPSPLGGVANVDFSETVRLSSIQTFDASGDIVDFGSITGASGRIYDATGVHIAVVSAPEPSTWAMMLLGFAGMGYAGYRRTQRRVPV